MSIVQTSTQHHQIFEDDQSFCQLYPQYIQQLDKVHWSPLAVIKRAASRAHFINPPAFFGVLSKDKIW